LKRAAKVGIVFAGAAIYVNLVEHPARIGCSTETAATVWPPSHKRGTWMQAPLATSAFSLALHPGYSLQVSGGSSGDKTVNE
jgi:hypothetical protein